MRTSGPEPWTAPAIEFRSVSKRYGPRTALDDVTFDVGLGAVCALVGPNGAGKTTVMRLLLGLTRSSAGSVRVLGQDAGSRGATFVRSRSGQLDNNGLYIGLTVRENLDIWRRMQGLAGDRVTFVLERLDIAKSRDVVLGRASLGLRRKTALARVLLGEPRLLVLDEPTNGLDPDATTAYLRLLRLLAAEQQLTVLISSHALTDIEDSITEIVALKAGRLRLAGQAGEFRAREARLIVGVSDRVLAMETLEAMGLRPALNGVEDELVVPLPDAAADPLVQAACRRLIEAGCGVHRLERRGTSLRRVYDAAMAEPLAGTAS